jgi:hypothetical protein
MPAAVLLLHLAALDKMAPSPEESPRARQSMCDTGIVGGTYYDVSHGDPLLPQADATAQSPYMMQLHLAIAEQGCCDAAALGEASRSRR